MKLVQLENKYKNFLFKQIGDSNVWGFYRGENDKSYWYEHIRPNAERIALEALPWFENQRKGEYGESKVAFEIMGEMLLYIMQEKALKKLSLEHKFLCSFTGMTNEIVDKDNFDLALVIGANLFSRKVDYKIGYSYAKHPNRIKELQKDGYGLYLNLDGIFHNELPALLNNLMLENSLQKLSKELDMEVDEWTSESTVNQPLIWKYGFKLDEWQMYDKETDDLFPNSAELIEAYLEGRAEDLRKETLERRLGLLGEDENKPPSYITEDEITKRMNKETTNEAERDKFTKEQLKEIERLIRENRKLKEKY